MVNIAGVGFNGSDMDVSVLIEALGLLNEPRVTHFDAVDLSRGRDFLTEEQTYDVVILNYIFVGSDEETHFYDPTTLLSPHHTSENWVKRLITTSAKTILIFCSNFGSEVDPRWLGEIPHYKHTPLYEGNVELHRYELLEVPYENI